MKITPNQTFKHERETYEEGQEYDVSEEDAEYFASVGFIGERIAGESASLDVQDGVIGHSSEVSN